MGRGRPPHPTPRTVLHLARGPLAGERIGPWFQLGGLPDRQHHLLSLRARGGARLGDGRPRAPGARRRLVDLAPRVLRRRRRAVRPPRDARLPAPRRCRHHVRGTHRTHPARPGFLHPVRGASARDHHESHPTTSDPFRRGHHARRRGRPHLTPSDARSADRRALLAIGLAASARGRSCGLGDPSPYDAIVLAAELYLENRDRLLTLAERLSDAEAATSVPALPGWTVQDAYAHLTGLCVDVVEGRMDGAGTPSWTARQVRGRAPNSLGEVCAEWAARGPDLDTWLANRDDQGTTFVGYDAWNHHQDIRSAVGLAGERDANQPSYLSASALTAFERRFPHAAPPGLPVLPHPADCDPRDQPP